MTRFLLCFLLLAVPGCGGHIVLAASDSGAPSGGDNGSSSGGDNGSSSGGSGQPGDPFPVCPGSAPKAGWSCPTKNQGCAYVDLKSQTCVSWRCNAKYQWESSTPEGC